MCGDPDDRNIELSSHECKEGNSKYWYKFSFQHYLPITVAKFEQGLSCLIQHYLVR